MPYPHSDPAPEEDLFKEGPELFTEVSNSTERELFRGEHPGHHSVCQTLREIYTETTDETTKTKIRLAWAMMKKMNARLHYYKNKYEPWRGKHA